MAITRLKRKTKRNKLKSVFRKNCLRHLTQKIVKKKDLDINQVVV